VDIAIEFNPSAFKHGVSEADIYYPLLQKEENNGKNDR
jgi:hypothetical protein